MNHSTTGLAALCAILLTGCTEESTDVSTFNAMPNQGKETPSEASATNLAELAIETLAKELNISPDSIKVDTVRAVEWRDSSLGCPQPDRAYLQVITPGHKITLWADGSLYTIHEANGKAFLCKRAKSTVGGVTRKLELEWGQQAGEARRDLAARLGVDVSKVRVASARGTTWPDESMGCPSEGAEFQSREVQGYILTLRIGQRDYTYHTDLDQVIPCPPIEAE